MPGPTILACCATLGLRTRPVVGIHAVYKREHQNRFSDKFLRFSTKYNRRVRFYAISKYAMEQWIEYARIKKERIKIVYNSISADFFEPSASSLWPTNLPDVGVGDYKVLFVGRLCQTKGLDTLIEAIGPILREEKMQLFIVGGPNGEPESFFEDEVTLLDRLTTQVACAGWSERVHFLGLREDVPEIMGCVDLLVHPARKEGFGLVLAEALAIGLPIAASNVDGIPEVLSDTDSILVLPGDPAAMRDAVLEIIRRTPEDAKRSCERARRRAECFRPERRVKDVMALFRDLSAAQASP
jgi:glycosyltransferase involved in cell wall biosynthesis